MECSSRDLPLEVLGAVPSEPSNPSEGELSAVKPQDGVVSVSPSDRGPRIEARGLCVGYGDVPVIHDLNLLARPGEVVALLGRNGAGKTTTLLALSGELAPMGGDLLVDGKRSTAPLHRRARSGLAYVTEERSVFKGMSTVENFRVGRVGPEKAFALFPELEGRARVKGGFLSGGEQQMLTLGRALAREPRVLLADELSLGLAPLIVRRLLDAVRAAADHGCAVVLVEQHIRQALRVADRAYVLHQGRVELEGTADDLLTRISDIEANYLA